MTQITGYIYDAQGTVITTGHLVLTLQQDIVSVEGTKVAPFSITIDLATENPAGYVDVTVYATVGATPSGVAYVVYFDPEPTDLTKPPRTKDGYWENYWAVPDSETAVPISNFVSALRGLPSNNYLPLNGAVGRLTGTHAASAGSSVGYLTLEINGVQRKIQYYAV